MAIEKINAVPYNDFKHMEVIEPDQFDTNNQTLVDKIDESIDVINNHTADILEINNEISDMLVSGVTVSEQDYQFVATESTTIISLSSSVYNPSYDLLRLYSDGLKLTEGVDYTKSGLNITLNSALGIGESIEYSIMKNVLIPLSSFDGNLLLNTSIGKEKLKSDVLDDIDTHLENHPSEFKKVVNIGGYVVGDGVADDTTAMLDAATDCLALGYEYFLPPEKIVRITSEVNLTGINNINLQGTVVVDCASGNGLVIGADAATNTPLHVYISKITEGGSIGAGVVGLRTQGIKNGDITIMFCFKWQLYANGSIANIGSSGYSRYHLGKIDDIEFLDINSGWINENKFFGGRVEKFAMNGTYAHNGNKFYGMELESADVDINVGYSNVWMNARLEGTNTIDFAAGTHSNIIKQDFVTTARAALGAVTATITDLGTNNVVIREHSLYKDIVSVVNLTKDTKIFNTTSEIGAVSVTAGLDKIAVANSTDLWSSDLIPVTKGSALIINSDQSNWRPKIYVYNASKQLLIGADAGYMNIPGSVWVDADAYYGFSSNKSSVQPGMITSSTVAYIKIVLRSGSSCVPFKYVDISMFAKKDGDIPLRLAVQPKIYPMALASSPTQGFAKLGQIVAKTDGTLFVCKKSLDYTLQSTVAGSATSITASSSTSIANGDIVGLLLDDGSTHWTTVSGLSGATFTVSALPSGATAGNRLVFNLWGTITT